MNERDELKKEIQFIVSLLQITEIDLEAFRVKDKESGVPIVMIYIGYTTASGLGAISGRREYEKNPTYIHDIYKVSHNNGNVFRPENIDLDDKQKVFEESVIRIMKIVEQYPYIKETKELFSLLKPSRPDSSEENRVHFRIKNSTHEKSPLAIVKISYDGPNFSFTKLNDKWIENYLELGEGDEYQCHPMSELQKVFNVPTPNEAIRLVERLRDYLFVLNDIDFAS